MVITDYAQETARILNENRPVESRNKDENNYTVYNNFVVRQGRKYDKVYNISTSYFNGEECGEKQKIELFVEKDNGNIYKPNTKTTPAKNVRYNVSTKEGKEELAKNCVNRGYLYVK